MPITFFFYKIDIFDGNTEILETYNDTITFV